MDLVNSLFVTDAELNSWITAALAELHDLLVGVDSEYLISQTTITANGSASYALPADFYKLKKVDYALVGTNGAYRDVPRVSMADANRFTQVPFGTSWTYGDGGPWRCRVENGNLLLYPQSSAGTLVVRYYPCAPQPASDVETFDVLNGFDEYLVADCCLRIAMKREDDPGPWFAIKRDMKQRVESMGADRDMADSWGMTIIPRGF